MTTAAMLLAGYLGVIGTGQVTHAAFGSTTNSAGNAFAAGTVTITDSSPGSALYTVTNHKPGDSDSACTLVRYTGSVPASVRSFATTTGDLAPYLNLTVTRGVASEVPGGNCATFTPDAGGGVLYSGTLAAYPSSWATGVVDPAAAWATNEEHAYRITVAVQDTADAQGKSATTRFTWEARS